MSVKTVSGNGLSGSGFVSDDRTEDGLLKVHGVALGENDITVGHLSKSRKLWQPDVLEEASDLLEGKDIVVDHENKSAYQKIGEITDSGYKEGVGVIYEGVVMSDELEPKIERNWLDVSPRIVHSEDSEEITENTEAPQEIYDFANLSVVRKGASHSNELLPGEHEELSIDDIKDEFDGADVVEYHSSVEELQSDNIDLTEYLYDNRNAAIGASESLGCSGSHTSTIEGEEWFLPCSSREDLLRNLSQKQSVTEENQDGSMKPSEGQMVRWQPVPDVVGRVVHVDSEKDIVMVTAEEPESASGMTFTAGYEDVIPTEMNEVEELQLSEARNPTYDGTEETSWADVSKDLSAWVDALGYEDIDTVEDLTEDQRSEIASHTLLGDSGGETWDELSYFPVVNPNTGNLNRGALEAVRGGRGQAADIPQDTYESAFATAGRLLNEEFDSDVEVEFEGQVEELASHEEMKRMAGQMSSMSALTREDAMGLLSVFDPNRPEEAGPLADSLERSFGVDREDVIEVLGAIGITENSGHMDEEDTEDTSSRFGEMVEDLSELEEFDDVESDELHKALSELIDSDEDSTDSGSNDEGNSSIVEADTLQRMFN